LKDELGITKVAAGTEANYWIAGLPNPRQRAGSLSVSISSAYWDDPQVPPGFVKGNQQINPFFYTLNLNTAANRARMMRLMNQPEFAAMQFKLSIDSNYDNQGKTKVTVSSH
jgi:hypothetical protein